MATKKLTEAETEKLIELVRDATYIYNSGDREHHDLVRLTNFWNSVSLEFNEKFSGKEFKKCWKNLCDSYSRNKKVEKSKSGQAAGQRRPYKWAKQLEFLDKCREITSTDGNVADQGDIHDDGSSQCFSQDGDGAFGGDDDGDVDITLGEDGRSSVQTASTSSHGLATVRPKGPKRPRPTKAALTAAPSSADRAISKLLAYHDEALKEDAEDAFYSSCAIRAKKLPAYLRAYLQVQTSQLFLNAENPNCIPMPITPIPMPMSVTNVEIMQTGSTRYVSEYSLP